MPSHRSRLLTRVSVMAVAGATVLGATAHAATAEVSGPTSPPTATQTADVTDSSTTATPVSFSEYWDWLCDLLKGNVRPFPTPGKDPIDLQVLSFNDFHGHLEAEDDPLDPELDPDETPVGGVEYLSNTLTTLREGHDNTVTVAAGDLIGGSTFLSGLFHDEPAIEAMNTLNLDVAGVGNHEFDEGTDELLRIIEGGCHPEDGCYFPGAPYTGTDFEYLAANVVTKDDAQPFLPPVSIREYQGVKVGFIGMTLEETPTLVNPAGVASVDFHDEVETANKWAEHLQSEGVETIVVLLHEGGFHSGGYNGCEQASGPIVDIASQTSSAVDLFVTGHTHQPYVCELPDPDGNPRLVTSASSYGRVVTDTHLAINPHTGDVIRDQSWATNYLVTQDGTPDPAQTAVITKWKEIADPLAARVVGTIAEDVTGDASGDRGGETPMVNLVADAILHGTQTEEDGGAQIAFMNVGGVRASFKASDITNGEQPGDITYAEAYATSPFGNLLVSMDLTGQQIKDVLEQQYMPSRSRELLALGVSNGFTYTWDDSKPEGERVVVDSMMLNGEPIDLAATYRVATLNFLADGGDSFSVFTEGDNILGGPEDLANLVDYLEANPGITPPADRVDGL